MTSENAFSLGVRQGENAEGYNPVWIEKVFSLYNAPPGTEQRMPVYFYLSPDDGDACRESVMAFTHGDRYKPLPGYKTMVDPLPHGVHAGVDRLREPRHDAAVDTDDAGDWGSTSPTSSTSTATATRTTPARSG